MFTLTVGLWTEYAGVHFSLSPAVVKVLPSSLMSFILSQTGFSGEKKKILGPGSKQEHSWDMFKIGQTALHSKVDIYSSVDFRNYGKAR